MKNNYQKGNLPANAVKFNEPDVDNLLKVASLFLIPVTIFCVIVIVVSIILHGSFRFEYFSIYSFLGFLFSFLMILPHELLHGICFGKDAEVELYYSIEKLIAFVVSTNSVSKKRFIFLSLLPNLVFGWIPFFIWAFIPLGANISSFLFVFSIVSISFGIGDYMNAYNAIRQMPKGSMQQLSGFHSFWYI